MMILRREQGMLGPCSNCRRSNTSKNTLYSLNIDTREVFLCLGCLTQLRQATELILLLSDGSAIYLQPPMP